MEILAIHFKAEFNWPKYNYNFRLRTGNLFPTTNSAPLSFDRLSLLNFSTCHQVLFATKLKRAAKEV